MTGHLPECRRMDDLGCICPELRDCEQRTLVAARDAVVATGIGALDPALAAIDALRGES